MALTFQRAIVVGASSGIGEAIARQLAAGGCAVALVARRREELERVHSSIAAAGGKGHVHVHDVTAYAETPALFESIVAELGGVDLVVYASGAMPKVEEGEYAFSKDRQMIEVNVLGAMAWLDLAAARFEGARSGTILGISSIAGERGRRASPGYTTSKAAFTTYLEALRNRCSRYGVNVVTVKPGFVDTPMTRGLQGMFWVISADQAAKTSLAMAARGSGASGFVPFRWVFVAMVLRLIPSFIFRKMNI